MREIIFGPPGTGKTTHLLRIVEKELKNKVSPNRIGYFAFTTKASEEALKRATDDFNIMQKTLPISGHCIASPIRNCISRKRM